MSWPRLTIRIRLTLLYTGLFAVCGATVVAITYALVAAMPQATSTADGTMFRGDPEEFLATCRQALRASDIDVNLKAKCETLFDQGVVSGARSQRDATLANLLHYSLLTMVVVSLLAMIAGWIVAGRVLRPVHQITAAARAASEHNLSARLLLPGPHDELRDLADTFDDMLGRLQDAFEGQRRFIANASHELRTPLTVMRATVDVVLAKTAPTPAELRSMGEDIRSTVDHAEALIDALLTLARSDRGLHLREEVDLATVAEDLLDSIDPGDRHLHASLQPAATTGDPVLLARLAANLLDNAIRHNMPGGDVWVASRTVDGEASLLVTNTGAVIAPDAVDVLFEPFRRLCDRTSPDGFGLGLAIVASVAVRHDGRVTAHPRPGGGLTVTVTLPSAGAPPHQPGSWASR
jgi:signal transduction histidine kinase